ncbi:MAG: hypothetical protein FWH29_10360 [Methanobrevibacter sp.]|nr:hypothetical protein [Methanobrevibacter sp.]
MKSNHKRFFIGSILIFILYLIGMAMVPAISTVTVTAKPSADSNLPYVNHTKTWYNFCPLCGSYDTLTINPKGTFEVELTCSDCGADYCGVTGKDKHGYGSRGNIISTDNNYPRNNLFMELMM